MLSVKHLSHQFNGYQVLEDINLEMQAGETVAILGASGVGKSTLFNLIAGLLEIQEGSITIHGDTNIQSHVSYMLQKDLLLPHYTIEENIMLPWLIQQQDKASARSKARALLEEFGLLKWAAYYPHALSGGMRQRVALLRTAAFGRKWVLLDEAFSALDSLTRNQLHQWFIEYRAAMGWSTLIITHNIDEALVLADRIYILKGQPGHIQAEFPAFRLTEISEDFTFTQEFNLRKRSVYHALIQ